MSAPHDAHIPSVNDDDFVPIFLLKVRTMSHGVSSFVCTEFLETEHFRYTVISSVLLCAINEQI